MASDLLAELNLAETACENAGMNGYSYLCEVFTSNIRWGRSMMENMDKFNLLSIRCQDHLSHKNPIAEVKEMLVQSTADLKSEIAGLKREIGALTSDLNEKAYSEVVSLARDFKSEAPFSSLVEAETYLCHSQENFDTLTTSFTSSEQVLRHMQMMDRRKKKWRQNPTPKEPTSHLPAGIILNFLFDSKVLASLIDHRKFKSIGPATQHFLVDRGRTLCGNWTRSDEDIMRRLRKHVHHKYCAKARNMKTETFVTGDT